MEQADNDEPNTRCRECGYEWEYSGSLELATCPSCQRKTETRNIEEDTEEANA